LPKAVHDTLPIVSIWVAQTRVRKREVALDNN